MRRHGQFRWTGSIDRSRRLPTNDDSLLSSGHSFLSLGTVGSTNGRGVFSSKKTGILIATLEPRRRRMLAVRVLQFQSRSNQDQLLGLFTMCQASETVGTHGKRTCWLVTSSGRNSDRATPPPGG